jgi:hypothetical protein
MKPVLDIIAEAVTKERWWCPAVMNDDGTLVLARDTSLFQRVVTVLCARATLRFGAGDFDGFLKDYVTARRLSAQVSRGAGASDRFFGHYAADLTAERTAGAVIATGKLTMEQCRLLLKAMDDAPALEPLAEGADIADRWSMLAGVCRFAAATDKQPLSQISFRPDGSKYMAEDERKKLETIDRAAVDWNLVLARVNAHIDAEIAAIRLPRFVEARDAYNAPLQKYLHNYWELKRTEDLHRHDGESMADYSERVARAMVTQVSTEAGHDIGVVRQDDMYEPMVRALLAAAMFKAKTGDWPDRLEQVVPEFLPAVGKDLYSEGADAPLSYIVGSRGPRVYSVGRNGKDEFGVQVPGGKLDDPHVGAEETELR